MKPFISLEDGEPEYRTPEHINKAMIEALDLGLTHYGDYKHMIKLRESIARYYARYGVEADPEHVVVTPGSTMGIYIALKNLVGYGGELIVMDPCYFGYPDTFNDLELKPRYIPRDKDNDWHFNIEDIKEAYTPETKAILVCSPDNPTGAVISDEQLAEIAEFAVEKDLMVVSDEIYDRIIYDGYRFRSIATFPDMKERTIILNGLSKTYAMTGWRLGYMIAPTQQLYDQFWATQMGSYLVIPEAIQYAGIAALEGPQDCVDEMLKGYKAKRDYAYDFWSDIPRINVSKPKGAFYVFPDITEYGLSSTKLTEYIRRETNVGITDGSLFGARGEGHIRISYAQSMENLVEGLDRINLALSKL
ncbi:MAG: aminotransferase class I/II-fold pyridoxal phosphate-dependent enzyme [Candidatus Bathyarchaeota archaeon]|nr:aminotransferase class I/II-fold pyridoxal phosphate-dependent enzyme [Candidatus Bathyarchaeota archaeon]